MPTVTELLIETWNGAPATFSEKTAALKFLTEGTDVENKMQMALVLLEEVAKSSGCHYAWKTLVAERLQAAERAMRFLLPRHRDHIIHSAHIYLLGVAIYLKILRCDPALAAVIADTHYRDVQAFFGPGDMPYSCYMRIIDPQKSLDENRKNFVNEYRLDHERLLKIGTPCVLCQPAQAVIQDAEIARQVLKNVEQCCRPSEALQNALISISTLFASFTGTTTLVAESLPGCLEDLDAIFRRRWGQIATLHDAAYPLELAAKQVEDYIAGTVGTLGCSFTPCMRSFGLSLNQLCDFLTMPLVQTVCATRFNNAMFGNNAITLIAANVSHKMHVEYTPDVLANMMLSWMEDGLSKGAVDHGVFSALLMLRMINADLRTRLKGQEAKTDLIHDDDTRRVAGKIASSAVEFFYIECVDAASAVYLHNAKRYIPLFKDRVLEYRDHPFAWLLFLCDQLQEWLRPSGADSDPMELFEIAKSYRIDFVPGPMLHFDFPVKGDVVRECLKQHLRLFGTDFAKCVK